MISGGGPPGPAVLVPGRKRRRITFLWAVGDMVSARIVAWGGRWLRKRCIKGGEFATPVLHLTFALGVKIFLNG